MQQNHKLAGGHQLTATCQECSNYDRQKEMAVSELQLDDDRAVYEIEHDRNDCGQTAQLVLEFSQGLFQPAEYAVDGEIHASINAATEVGTQ